MRRGGIHLFLVIKNKIKTRSQIVRLVRQLKKRKKRIVFTNGCFDILHSGHVYYLEHAKRLGDCLVVGLNSDRSVQRIKGKGRPINFERDRACVLSALASVDFVCVFNEETPLDLIKLIKPDALVKGSDWKTAQITGAKEVLSWGGKVKRVTLLKGRSTTATIEKLKK